VTGPRSTERGAADATALVAALLLGALAFVPTLLLRQGEGWRKCNAEALRVELDPRGKPGARPGFSASLAAAAKVPAGSPRFVPDPSRRFGPVPAATETAPPAPTTGPRVADLDGKVVDGRLVVRWTPAPGSRGTTLRVEGIGTADAVEREIPAGTATLELPVPGISGTLVVKASAVGAAGSGPEVRVSIPYRIAVEVVRAERAHAETGSAILRLRRFFDGAMVEADFALQETDSVGDLSSVVPGGPVVDFRTDLVLEEVRDLKAPGPFIEVPLFGPEGRVVRDPEGHPLSYGRASIVDAGQEVVLRGPNDERRVLPVR